MTSDAEESVDLQHELERALDEGRSGREMSLIRPQHKDLWFRGLRLVQVSMPPIWQGTALQGPLVLRHPGDGGLLC